jgi:hypothetical protein
MSTAGRPKVLDEGKQSTVCSLVAAGVSLRQAADFVDCDRRSIRRAAERNDEFRRKLAKAKSQANIHPLETLQRAARTDWRAALHWMERLDPKRFARPSAAGITQREANQFVADLIETIEKAVTSPRQRAGLYELLSAIMPAAMRRRWDGQRVRRNIEQAKRDFEETRNAEDQKWLAGIGERAKRRHDLLVEIGKYLPLDLYYKLGKNTDLLDPEEVFPQRPEASAHPTGAPAEPQQEAGANGSPTNIDPTTSGIAVAGLTNVDLTIDGTTNNAPPTDDIVPPPGRNPDDFAPPPLANLSPPNDLPSRDGAKSTQ